MKKKEFKINLERENLEAKYSDTAIIGHSETAMNIDFAQMMSHMDMINIVSRIVLNHRHAKSLYIKLGKHIEEIEKEYGTIETVQLIEN